MSARSFTLARLGTLVRRAVKDTPYEKLADQMVGPLMYWEARDLEML